MVVHHPELDVTLSSASSPSPVSVSGVLNRSLNESWFLRLIHFKFKTNCRGLRRGTDFRASLPPSKAAASVFSPSTFKQRESHVSFLLGKEGTGLAGVWVVFASEALIRVLT